MVERLEREYDGRVDVWRVNADEEPEVVRGLGVMGIPTLVAFRAGKEITRKVGAGSEANLRALFDAAVSGQAPASDAASPPAPVVAAPPEAVVPAPPVVAAPPPVVADDESLSSPHAARSRKPASGAASQAALVVLRMCPPCWWFPDEAIDAAMTRSARLLAPAFVPRADDAVADDPEDPEHDHAQQRRQDDRPEELL